MGNTLSSSKTEAATMTEAAPSITEHEAMKALVDHIMKNRAINISMVPDSIERQLYMNILTAGFAWLKETIDTVHIEILDHVITFHIESKTL